MKKLQRINYFKLISIKILAAFIKSLKPKIYPPEHNF